MLASLTSHQLGEWYAYLALEPIGEFHANARADYRAGVIAATVANYAGKTRIDGAEPAHPADFFASLDDTRSASIFSSAAPLLMPTPEDQAQLIKASLFGLHDG